MTHDDFGEKPSYRVLGVDFDRRWGSMEEIHRTAFRVALVRAREFVADHPGAGEEEVREFIHDFTVETAGELLDQVRDMAEMRMVALENFLMGFVILFPRMAELVLNPDEFVENCMALGIPVQ
jgi:hypothetical protein